MTFEVGVDKFGTYILSYALVLASVGAIVMALQEVFKNIFRWRCTFNRKQFNNWLKNDKNIRSEFITLTTGGYESEDALFDQSVDKMMGQIQAAANMALDFPNEYSNLYAFLSSIPEESKDSASDKDKWKNFASLRPTDISSKFDDPNQAANDASRARARLGNLVARKLDAFQNQTQYAWADANQKISVITSAALIALILSLSGFVKNPLDLIILIALSIAGGATAPFAKDVVSGLSQFSKGK